MQIARAERIARTQLVSRAETAQLLGVSVRTVIRLERARRLRPVRLRSRVLYRLASIERLAKRGAGDT